MSRRSLAWFVLCALHTAGCSDSSSGTAGERDASATLDAAGPSIDGGSTERKVSGRVIDAQSVTTLANAELTTESGASTSSQSDGRYELVAGPSDRDLTAARKSFAATYKPLPSAAGTLDVYLKSVDEGAQFRGDEGITVTLASGVKLVIPKDAVTDAEGNKVAGLVSLELAAIDGKQPTQAASLPGDMTAEQKDSKQGRLSVDDGLSIRIVDAENKELTVDKGADVVAEVPARKDADGPQSVYSYDTKERRWKEEGTAPLGMNGEGKAVYRADIDHLSWWALGRFFEKVGCVRACVEDADGKPVAGAQVWVVGESVAGVSTFHTDKAGCGAGDAIAGADVVLVAQQGRLVSSNITVSIADAAVSASDDPSACTDAGTLTLGAGGTCALCSVGPNEPIMDGGVDMDASSPDAGLDASTSTPEAGVTGIVQEAAFSANAPDPSDYFGYRVAISGDTLVIGAAAEGSNATGIDGDETNDEAGGSGAAFVFVRSGSTWTQQAYLKASNTESNDSFGYAVDIDGDTIVIGAPSEDGNATTTNGNQADNSASGAGAAYVFVRSGSTWTQQAYLKASNAEEGDGFGESVAVYNNTIVVGAPGEDADLTGQGSNDAIESGAAYVFFRSGVEWVPTRYLKASNAEAGDRFGKAVAVDGSTIVVGAIGEDSNSQFAGPVPADNSASDSGAVYVFVESGTSWSQQAYVKSINTDQDDEFGESIGISGDTLVIGASGEDSSDRSINGDGTGDNSADNCGAAYVYTRTGTNWFFDSYLKASNGRENHDFGESVSIDGDRLLVGAYQDDSLARTVNGDQTNAANSLSVGAAFLFVRGASGWTQAAYLKASNSAAGDLFGSTVGVADDTYLVGAYGKGGNVGAAYVYR